MDDTHSSIKKFLSSLFGNVGEAYWLYLWELKPAVQDIPQQRGAQGRKNESHWFQAFDLDRMAKRAFELDAAGSDVYFGVAISSKRGTPASRCASADVAGIVGVWLDVDYGTDGHKKTNLPGTQEEALALVAELYLQPSLVVFSGHGLQPWWLFKEPWVFSSPEERNRAAAMTRGWSTLLRQRAKQHNWDEDATGDLARVLRVPWTKNKKTPPPVLATVLSENEKRYNSGDFEEFLESVSEPQVTIGPLHIGPVGGLPEKILELHGKKKFKDTWERQRDDLQDQSASGYDMALASFAVRAGWDDQSIVDLLVAAAAKHGEQPKDKSYYSHTIGKSRKIQGENVKQWDELDSAVAAFHEADNGDVDRNQKAQAAVLMMINKMLEINVLRIIRSLAAKPIFSLELDCGRIVLGGIEGLDSQQVFRREVAQHTKKLPKRLPGKAWDKVAQAMLDISEDEDLGEISSEKIQCNMWLENYLRSVPKPVEFTTATVHLREPFLHNGVAFFLGSFRAWLKGACDESPTSKWLGAFLRRCGIKPAIVRLGDTTCNVWIVPPGHDRLLTFPLTSSDLTKIKD